MLQQLSMLISKSLAGKLVRMGLFLSRNIDPGGGAPKIFVRKMLYGDDGIGTEEKIVGSVSR